MAERKHVSPEPLTDAQVGYWRTVETFKASDAAYLAFDLSPPVRALGLIVVVPAEVKGFEEYLLDNKGKYPRTGGNRWIAHSRRFNEFTGEHHAVRDPKNDGPAIFTRETIMQAAADRGLKPKAFADERHGDTHEALAEYYDREDWPEELGIAFTAWRAAVNSEEVKSGNKRPGAFIRGWLAEHYPERPDGFCKRIATVANWKKGPGCK